MYKYYQLMQSEQEADLYIYGDITSVPLSESDVSAHNLSQKIVELNVNRINVYLSSYGGEVAEGLAIYNSLKRHKAKVTTVCDGFACSIASVIFMAGDERIMNESSLLMIHNAWTWASGNADELRKQAEDLDTVNQASITAYMSGVSITEDEVKDLMNKESWIAPADALSWGFATAVESSGKSDKPSQNARKVLFAKMAEKQPAPVQVTIDEDSIVQKLFEKLKQQEPKTAEPKEPEKSLMQILSGFINA